MGSNEQDKRGTRASLDNRYRMDVVQRVIAVDEIEGTVESLIEPDPRRYTWIDREGEQLLYDELDDVYFPRSLVMTMLQAAIEMPHPAPVEVLDDLDRWISERRAVVASVLDGETYPGAAGDKAVSTLESLPASGAAFVITSVDIDDSSSWVQSTPPHLADQLLQVFAFEVGLLISVFHGQVLRHEGDGLMAYFAEPGFISKNDLAVDCAFCIQRLVGEAISPELEARGAEPIKIRIGIEAGEATVVLLGCGASKRQTDLIGEVLSIASNVRKQAEPGEVLIGEICERNSHLSWRGQLSRIEPRRPWTYTFEDGTSYGLFLLDRCARRPIEEPQPTLDR